MLMFDNRSDMSVKRFMWHIKRLILGLILGGYIQCESKKSPPEDLWQFF